MKPDELEQIMQILWPLIACATFTGGLLWGIHLGRESKR